MTPISKESLLKKFDSGALLFQPDVRKIIEKEPEVEAEPVKYGKWVHANPMVYTLMCSECGYNILSEELISNYCPDCGARMDGERRTDE